MPRRGRGQRLCGTRSHGSGRTIRKDGLVQKSMRTFHSSDGLSSCELFGGRSERWRDHDAVAKLSEDASDGAIQLAARAAFDVASAIVQLNENEEDIEAPDPLPDWLLIECDGDGKPTGRVLGGLHESVLETDPRNIEPEDILGR